MFLFDFNRIRRLRKEIPQKEIRRIARTPWKKLTTNFVSYVDDDIVVLDWFDVGNCCVYNHMEYFYVVEADFSFKEREEDESG